MTGDPLVLVRQLGGGGGNAQIQCLTDQGVGGRQLGIAVVDLWRIARGLGDRRLEVSRTSSDGVRPQ